MNTYIMTFDTEEWYIEKAFKGGRREKYKQYDEILDWILKTLEQYHIKATFFCVGELAIQFPEVVKCIAQQGHEIGSHSNRHLWVTKMNRQEFSEDTRRAVQSLEDLTGRKVKSFRAPAFSIGQDNAWAFEVLAENGIERDCSIFPASRDFGGFPQFESSIPSIVKSNHYSLKEFPISPAKVLGKSLPFSGGGYFRLIPLFLQKHFIEQMNYIMFYFHINDLIEQKTTFMSKAEYEEYFKEPGTLKNRVSRYIKANIGKGGALSKLDYLLGQYKYVNVEQAAQMVDWQKSPVVIV